MTDLIGNWSIQQDLNAPEKNSRTPALLIPKQSLARRINRG
jgi:hypothetical protein